MSLGILLYTPWRATVCDYLLFSNSCLHAQLCVHCYCFLWTTNLSLPELFLFNRSSNIFILYVQNPICLFFWPPVEVHQCHSISGNELFHSITPNVNKWGERGVGGGKGKVERVGENNLNDLTGLPLCLSKCIPLTTDFISCFDISDWPERAALSEGSEGAVFGIEAWRGCRAQCQRWRADSAARTNFDI